MDDGRLMILICLMVFNMMIYGFGAAIHYLKRDEVERKANEDETDTASVKILKIMEDQISYIYAIYLFGILVNLWIGRFFLPDLEKLFVSNLAVNGMVATLLSYFLLVWFLLAFCVIFPRKLFASHARRAAYALVYPVNLLLILLKPLTVWMTGSAKVLLLLLRQRDSLGEADVTEEEILSMVSEGQEQGVLQDSEADMITNIFELSDKQARDIMTDRNEIVGVDADLTLDEAMEYMMAQNNSRYPVYLENIDHIIGILHIRDAMKAYDQEEMGEQTLRKIKGLLRRPVFVPETRNIDMLFKSMQSTKTQMVVVMDEYGQTAGLISMEDILEEIVGDIRDEYDEEDGHIRTTARKDEFLIDGRTPLEELEERFHIQFDTKECETINGYLIMKLDHIPSEHEVFETDVGPCRFAIEEVKNHMIQKVQMTKLPEEGAEDHVPGQEQEPS